MLNIENKYGPVNISYSVLANLVGVATTSCYGVVGMASRNASDGIAAILRQENYEKGIRVDVVNEKLNIDLHIVALYGVNLSAIAESITHKVKYTVEEQTGFEVGEITVYVDSMRV